MLFNFLFTIVECINRLHPNVGYYPIPEDRTKFLVCNSGRAWEFDCAHGLVWRMTEVGIGHCGYSLVD